MSKICIETEKLKHLKCKEKLISQAATGHVLYKSEFLEILKNSQERPVSESLFLIKLSEALRMFSCEFCKISKNIIITGHLWVTASVIYQMKDKPFPW